jgi:dTDP-4-dehydrorhamnose reductase
MRLVVTGSSGGLGRAFMDQLPGHHDVAALTHDDLDIGDHSAVMQTVVLLAPEAILNFAAFTEVDLCESEPTLAYRANTVGPQNLALAARRAGAMLLHVSTDYVFGGEKESPYDELDVPAPRSVYARSKLAGEEHVRRLLPESFVVRTGFVFGGGADFLTGQLQLLLDGKDAAGLEDRVGSPIYVRDLATRMIPLVVSERFGTYHVGGPEATTWFDALQRAVRIGDLAGEVHAQRAAELALPAPRPRNSALRSLFTGELGLEPVRPLDEALGDLLGRLG